MPGFQYTRIWKVFSLVLEGSVQEMVGLFLNCEFHVMMVVVEAIKLNLSGPFSTFFDKQSTSTCAGHKREDCMGGLRLLLFV